ncbi:chemotaxis protein CheW [Massilia sp. TS11]|uniref:chemotaxis protein CheW n=1 Tax=Massilia sp. TS11 TaxID=2908003 RepID=UPI001EDAE1A5|nr:chemotaxis protein CheW [Massilia sp. TS11]MCG2583287.1 chemotaxis protein CheW [Massilia sp. TS11]
MHDYLSFHLGGLEYGVAFAQVRELRMLQSLERFMADGEVINGVAVSRGVVIPLVDMRVAFGSQGKGPTDVIVLQLRDCVIGVVVDGVTDVVRIDPAQVTLVSGAPDYLPGIAEVQGRRLILVDMDRLMQVRRRAAKAA